MKKETHIIDASGKVLGRLASQIAVLLLGKHKSNINHSKEEGNLVIVKNVEKMKFSGKKLEKEKYYQHSRYLGGLKEIPLKKIFKEKPSEILKKAVYGMLPKNRLRKRIIKRLKFE